MLPCSRLPCSPLSLQPAARSPHRQPCSPLPTAHSRNPTTRCLAAGCPVAHSPCTPLPCTQLPEARIHGPATRYLAAGCPAARCPYTLLPCTRSPHPQPLLVPHITCVCYYFPPCWLLYVWELVVAHPHILLRNLGLGLLHPLVHGALGRRCPLFIDGLATTGPSAVLGACPQHSFHSIFQGSGDQILSPCVPQSG